MGVILRGARNQHYKGLSFPGFVLHWFFAALVVGLLVVCRVVSLALVELLEFLQCLLRLDLLVVHELGVVE